MPSPVVFGYGVMDSAQALSLTAPRVLSVPRLSLSDDDDDDISSLGSLRSSVVSLPLSSGPFPQDASGPSAGTRKVRGSPVASGAVLPPPRVPLAPFPWPYKPPPSLPRVVRRWYCGTR